MARWISPDPLTIHGFGSDPNPYAFVHGSPIRYIDPLGLDPESDDGDNDDGDSCSDCNWTLGSGPGGSTSGGASGGSAGGPPSGPSAHPLPPAGASASGVIIAGAIWTDPAGNYVRWNPYATQPVGAMLLGSETPIDPLQASLQANPDLALFVRSGGIMVLQMLPVVGTGLAVNTVFDPHASTFSRVLAGGMALLSVIPVIGGAAEEVQVLKNFASGGKFQNAVGEALQTTSNGALFHGGPLSYMTRPDFLSEAALVEAKSGEKLVTLSKQLEAEMTASSVSNRTYVLVLGMKTPISKPAMNAIIGPDAFRGIAGGVNGIIVRFDPVSKLFYEFVPPAP